MKVREFPQLPEGLLDCEAQQLHAELGGPTLFCLPGRSEAALFVSVLMHGNETSGWDAVREVLSHYDCGGGERELPRSMLLFVANTEAAAEGLRHLPGQPDYNRVWPGSELPACAEQDMMTALMERLGKDTLFASVDVHNNTGLNPHYACVNYLDNASLHLATMFARTVVYFTTPQGVQSKAMASLCPAVTLECGLAGESRSREHAVEFIEACLHLSEHPAHAIAARDIDLFHTTGIVRVADGVDFGFDSEARDLQFFDDIEFYNFRELQAGTAFGRTAAAGLPLQVLDEQGVDVSGTFFELQHGELRTRKPLMPSMLTRDTRVIRQDCLCYLMERYPLDAVEKR